MRNIRDAMRAGCVMPRTRPTAWPRPRMSKRESVCFINLSSKRLAEDFPLFLVPSGQFRLVAGNSRGAVFLSGLIGQFTGDAGAGSHLLGARFACPVGPKVTSGLLICARISSWLPFYVPHGPVYTVTCPDTWGTCGGSAMSKRPA